MSADPPVLGCPDSMRAGEQILARMPSLTDLKTAAPHVPMHDDALVCKQACCARCRGGLYSETRQGSELAGEDWRADHSSARGGLPHHRIAASRESHGHSCDSGTPPPPEMVPRPCIASRQAQTGFDPVSAHFQAPVEDAPHAVEALLDEELPSLPELELGQLDNGLRYVILPNKVPADRFEAHLEIHAGASRLFRKCRKCSLLLCLERIHWVLVQSSARHLPSLAVKRSFRRSVLMIMLLFEHLAHLPSQRRGSVQGRWTSGRTSRASRTWWST